MKKLSIFAAAFAIGALLFVCDAGSQNKLAETGDSGKEVKQAEFNDINWYKEAAQQGNAEAQYKLGIMYKGGEGVQEDYDKALHWLEKAAEQGDDYARIVKDELLHIKQTKKAAEAGDAESQHKLGAIYYYGLGIDQNYDKALHWFKKAAELGSFYAQYMLGEMYYQGHGVKQDYAEAENFYMKVAEEQGDPAAQYKISVIYMFVKEDYNEAIKWCKRAAEQGQPDAQYILESFLLFEQRKKSAEAGDAQSQYELGVMFGPTFIEPGDETVYNYAKAEKWYRKAAEQGHSDAQNKLGRIYYYGFHDPVNGKRDYAEAVKWFKKAAENGLDNAGMKYRLGDLCYYGAKEYEGVEQDYAEAMKWYKKALENGIEKVDNSQYGHLPLRADVLSKIGTMYYYGLGVEKDVVEGEKFLREAAPGSTTAREILEIIDLSKN